MGFFSGICAIFGGKGWILLFQLHLRYSKILQSFIFSDIFHTIGSCAAPSAFSSLNTWCLV